jgi:dTDP-4-amino-4,6-dideoxygalactose transaminase
MSDIAAIYINNYLNNFKEIFEHHTSMIKYFDYLINKNNLNQYIKLYKNYADYTESLMSCIPVIFEHKIGLDKFTYNNIEAKKYYYPLDNSPKSHEIIDKIICLPLNLEITEKIIELYIEIINDILK